MLSWEVASDNSDMVEMSPNHSDGSTADKDVCCHCHNTIFAQGDGPAVCFNPACLGSSLTSPATNLVTPQETLTAAASALGTAASRHFNNDGGYSEDDESDSSLETGHCHSTALLVRMEAKEERERKARNKLIGAIFLCSLFAGGEMLAGHYVGSRAIVSDAIHMVADASNLIASLVAILIARGAESKRSNFGRGRAEALGALLTVLAIYSVAGYVVYGSVVGLASGKTEIHSLGMIVAGACAVAFNIVLLLYLKKAGLEHGHSHGGSLGQFHIPHSHEGPGVDSAAHDHTRQLNVSAAIAHTVGDILFSSFVLSVSVIIHFFPGMSWLDPVAALVLSVFIFAIMFGVLRSSIAILMETIPSFSDYDAIYADLRRLRRVRSVHDLRMWCISTSLSAATVHLVVSPKNGRSGPIHRRLTREATKVLRENHGFDLVTVQVEVELEDENCAQCLPLEK